MKKFAKNTRVSVERSRAEIEHIVLRYGATRLMTAYESDRCALVFEFRGHRVRFILPMPDRKIYKRQDSYDKEHRRLWRAFALVIKAQLEAVVSGVFTFEELFLAQIVDPQTNKTFGERFAHPQLKAASS